MTEKEYANQLREIEFDDKFREAIKNNYLIQKYQSTKTIPISVKKSTKALETKKRKERNKQKTCDLSICVNECCNMLLFSIYVVF